MRFQLPENGEDFRNFFVVSEPIEALEVPMFFFRIVGVLTFVAGRYGGHGLYAELLCPWYYGLRGTEKGNVVESCGLHVALDKTPVGGD